MALQAGLDAAGPQTAKPTGVPFVSSIAASAAVELATVTAAEVRA